MKLTISDKDNQDSVVAGASKEAPKIRTAMFDRTNLNYSPIDRNLNLKPKGHNNKHKLLIIILSIVLTIVIGAGVFGYNRIVTMFKNIGIDVTPKTIIGSINNEVYELKKDSSGTATNALLVGIDTRENDKSLVNTDTIVVVSYNYKSNEIVMLSIPRDTLVYYPLDTKFSTKINAVYGEGEAVNPDKGMEELKKTVEKFTGLEIQYYGMVDLQGFKQGIDTLGGVTINVDNSFTDYGYPADPGSASEYQVVKFTSGIQEMNGDLALKYARSRKSLDAGEGSDYARAKRQQKVIKAVKDKVFASETWLNPNKILELMANLEQNIKISEVTLQDIKAGIDLSSKLKDAPIYSFVFDPLIGGGEVIYEDRATWFVYPTAGIGNYTDTLAITKAITENPKLYSENAVVYVYDIGLGYYPTLSKITELRKEYPYLKFYYQGTLFYNKEGNYVYNNSADESFAASLKFYTDMFSITDPLYKAKPEFINSRLNGEDIVILLGKEVVTEEPTVAQD
jgi:polyisoprenyl-teichoic acid--peptidoglycan teichoic acid transferase